MTRTADQAGDRAASKPRVSKSSPPRRSVRGVEDCARPPEWRVKQVQASLVTSFRAPNPRQVKSSPGSQASTYESRVPAAKSPPREAPPPPASKYPSQVSKQLCAPRRAAPPTCCSAVVSVCVRAAIHILFVGSQPAGHPSDARRPTGRHPTARRRHARIASCGCYHAGMGTPPAAKRIPRAA